MLNTEWTEIEEIQLEGDSSDSYGVTIAGGRSTGVVVKSIQIGKIADLDGRLRVADTILVVNNSSTRGMNCNQVAKMIRQSSNSVSLIAGRPIRETTNRISKKMVIRTTSLSDPNLKIQELLDKAMQRKLNVQFVQMLATLDKHNDGIGITATNLIDERGDGISGIFITSIDPDGSAARDGRLRVLDQIEAVNGVPVRGVSLSQAVQLIQSGPSSVTLRLKRYSGRFLDDLERIIGGAGWVESQPSDDMIQNSMLKTVSDEQTVKRANIWNRILGPSYEILVVELIKAFEDNLGLRLEGTVGSEKVVARHFVNDLRAGSVAATNGQLKVKDEILQVNENVLLGQPHSRVIEVLKSLPRGISTFYVARKRVKSCSKKGPALFGRPFVKKRKNRSFDFYNKSFDLWQKDTFDVTLQMSPSGLGLSFLEYQDSPFLSQNSIIVVRQVIRGGVASGDGRIMAGDRLVSVNGIAIDGLELSWVLTNVRATPVGVDVNLTFNRAISNCLRHNAAVLGGAFASSAAVAVSNPILRFDQAVSEDDDSIEENAAVDEASTRDEHAAEEMDVVVGVGSAEHDDNVAVVDDDEAIHDSVLEFVDDIIRQAIEQSIKTKRNSVQSYETGRESAINTHVEVAIVKLVGITKALLPEFVDFDASLYHSCDSYSLRKMYRIGLTGYLHRQSRIFGNSFVQKSAVLRRGLSHIELSVDRSGMSVVKLSDTTSKDDESSVYRSGEHRLIDESVGNDYDEATTDISRCITRAFLNKDVIFFPNQLERLIKIKKKFESIGLQLDPYVHEGVNGCQIVGIKSDSAVAKDGRLHLYDYITCLNNENMRKIGMAQARNILRRASLIFGEVSFVYMSNRDTQFFETNFHDKKFGPIKSAQSCDSINRFKKSTNSVNDDDGRLARSQNDLEKFDGQIWAEPSYVAVPRNEDGTLGISVVGRKRKTKTINGRPAISIIIKRIIAGSPASRISLLDVGDRIFEINGLGVESRDLDEVVEILRLAESPVILGVQRFRIDRGSCEKKVCEERLKQPRARTKTVDSPPPPPPPADNSTKKPTAISDESQRNELYRQLEGRIIEIVLERKDDETRLGLSLVGNSQPSQPGIYVCDIAPDSPADRCQRFEIGDELLEVNRSVLYGKCHANATPIIKAMKGSRVRFLIHRHPLGMEKMAFGSKSDRRLRSQLHRSESAKTEEIPAEIDSDDVKMINVSNDLQASVEDPNDPRVRPIVIGSPSVILIEDPNKDDLYLGISLVGGVGTPMGAILVHDIFETGCAFKDGRLMVGDQILEVNGVDVSKSSCEQCMDLIRESISCVELKVIRGPDDISSLDNEDKLNKISVDLVKKQNRGLGISITKLRSGRGAYISGIIEGGAAEKDGRLIAGDVLLEANGRKISKLAYDDIVVLLKTLPFGKVNLKIGRLKVNLAPIAETSSSNPVIATTTTTQQTNATGGDSSSFRPVHMLRAAASNMKQRHLRSRSAPNRFTRRLSHRIGRRKTTNVSFVDM